MVDAQDTNLYEEIIASFVKGCHFIARTQAKVRISHTSTEVE
jgi:hypothetical protein